MIAQGGTSFSSTAGRNPSVSIETGLHRAARIAGVFFIIATTSTMAAQVPVTPLIDLAQNGVEPQTHLAALAVLLDLANALAGAGIAIALYPVLRRFAEIAATGNLGLRIVEGAIGVAAAAIIAMIVMTDIGDPTFVIGLHDAAFLLVLIVFICCTLLPYPMLFVFRPVPRALSLWVLPHGLNLTDGDREKRHAT